MNQPYACVRQMTLLYRSLQDEQSRRLFWDRLRCDVYPSVAHVTALYADAFDLSPAERAAQLSLGERAHQLHRLGKKLLLYGAGCCGSRIAEMFQLDAIPFAGFCDRRADELRTVYGKPVYPPEYLFSHQKDCCVLITVSVGRQEILEVLRSHSFPQRQILNYFDGDRSHQAYFDFLEYFPRGTAFVDGGCYDAGTSLQFARRCGGDYSKIFAFEPDGRNRARCRAAAAAAGLRDFQLLPAGLGRKSGTAPFAADSLASSHVKGGDELSRAPAAAGSSETTIPISALDDVVGDATIGFIKLDIEGSELDALHGAERTLQRDAPLLAVCVYHRPGDLLAIMDFLSTAVPRYRFWLRHYTATPLDTVLYAAVPDTMQARSV